MLTAAPTLIFRSSAKRFLGIPRFASVAIEPSTDRKSRCGLPPIADTSPEEVTGGAESDGVTGNIGNSSNQKREGEKTMNGPSYALGLAGPLFYQPASENRGGASFTALVIVEHSPKLLSFLICLRENRTDRSGLKAQSSKRLALES